MPTSPTIKQTLNNKSLTNKKHQKPHNVIGDDYPKIYNLINNYKNKTLLLPSFTTIVRNFFI